MGNDHVEISQLVSVSIILREKFKPIYEKKREKKDLVLSSKMNRSIATVFVIFFALVSWIQCDICDICVCIKNECNVSNSPSCSNRYEEYFVCDGNEKKQQNIDLNTIQWPNRQINASMTFNNFKLSYLTK